MTVEEMFEKEKLDPDFIRDNFEGDYWDACDKFVREKWYSEIEQMTVKQANWFGKILDQCIETRIANQ